MRLVLILNTLFFFLGCNNGKGIISAHHTEQLSLDNVNPATDTSRRQDCDSLRKELSKTEAGNFGKVTRIPHNFEESLSQLDTLTNPRMRDWIKCLPDGEFSAYVHFSFGMYLRNKWGLWRNSRLSKSMFKMGVLHPDDMTDIILTSYQRKLKGENIRIQEQLKYYQDYWRNNGMPVDSILRANR